VADCPQLQRMSNHYSDFTFAGEESAALLDEIIAVSEKLTPASLYQRWLKQFCEACRSAMTGDLSIFVFL
jgi:hypothetical protein